MAGRDSIVGRDGRPESLQDAATRDGAVGGRGFAERRFAFYGAMPMTASLSSTRLHAPIPEFLASGVFRELHTPAGRREHGPGEAECQPPKSIGRRCLERPGRGPSSAILRDRIPPPVLRRGPRWGNRGITTRDCHIGSLRDTVIQRSKLEPLFIPTSLFGALGAHRRRSAGRQAAPAVRASRCGRGSARVGGRPGCGCERPGRSRADAPGSSTFSVTSQTVARSNNTLGRSVPVQQRA
jgi:hypothetical protein